MSKKKKKHHRNRAKELRHKIRVEAKRNPERRLSGGSGSFERWIASIEASIDRIEKEVNDKLDDYVLNQVDKETDKIVSERVAKLANYKITEETNPYLPLTKYPDELRKLGIDVSNDEVTHYPDLNLVRHFVEMAEQSYLENLEGEATRGKAKGKRYTQYKVQTMAEEMYGYTFSDWLSSYYIRNQHDRSAFYSPELLVKDHLAESIEAYEMASRIRNIEDLEERERQWETVKSAFVGG